MTNAKSGDTVRFHYTGRLTDGTQFDSSVGGDPLEVQLGTGQIISGLDASISGMSVGETATVNIAVDDAYGQHDPAKIQKVERARIPDDIDLQPGLQLGARTEDGGQVTLTVVEVAEDAITLDANHPLAGKDLVFEVELVEIL